MKKNFLLFIILLPSVCLHTAVKMPKVFGGNMVLQRNKPVHIWDWMKYKYSCIKDVSIIHWLFVTDGLTMQLKIIYLTKKVFQLRHSEQIIGKVL